MKKLASFLCAALLAVAVRAADALPLFNATLTIGKEHRFVLVGVGGKTSPFLSLGEKFEGYTLKAYDAKTGLLDLERDGKVTQVSLVGGAVIANGPALNAKATVADAEELFRTMRFDEMMTKLMDGQKKAMGPTMQASIDQSLARANINMSPEDRAVVAAAQAKMLDETLSAITGPEMRGAMARIYSEVFTKDELNNMAAFYATPGGQALTDKQPEVQEKMMGVMMPLVLQKQQAAQQEMTKTLSEIRAKYGRGGAGAAGAAPVQTPAAPAAPKN